MESKPTIYDVAKAAGVAASTVSRAFARPGRVSAETAQRVFAAAAGIGYRSDALPGLTTTRTRSLALVVTDITNPFYSELIRGAHEAAGAAGYTILLSHTQEDAQLDRPGALGGLSQRIPNHANGYSWENCRRWASGISCRQVLREPSAPTR